jgi:hypothetical protein
MPCWPKVSTCRSRSSWQPASAKGQVSSRSACEPERVELTSQFGQLALGADKLLTQLVSRSRGIVRSANGIVRSANGILQVAFKLSRQWQQFASMPESDPSVAKL